MLPQIKETASNSPFVINCEKLLKPRQSLWTIKSLGIELEEKAPFTKGDFEKALKKVSRRIKK